MSIITHIATALPGNRYSQVELASFMSDMFQYSEPQKRKIHSLYAKSGIEARYSAVADYGSTIEERTFFPKTRNLAPFPSLEQRMELYNREAPGLAIKAIKKCTEGNLEYDEITHLITVSCTGLSAPGLDIEIVQRLKLNENINRTSVNFMGCYAAIHALKQADYICKSNPGAVVLIVCVELCSIHFQKIEDADNLTANLLFSDGAAAVIVKPDLSAGNGYRMEEFFSQIALDGKNDMAWQLSSYGFLMTLSSYIPDLIERGIKDFFEKAAGQVFITKDDIKHWAIHPGGRKILEAVQEELQLETAQLESSYRVLKEYGNMSSPTVLFVLKDIMERKAKKGDKTFCVAFGPGLTMESVILENV
jgi:predicted naringenin-chalcone synthase